MDFAFLNVPQTTDEEEAARRSEQSARVMVPPALRRVVPTPAASFTLDEEAPVLTGTSTLLQRMERLNYLPEVAHPFGCAVQELLRVKLLAAVHDVGEHKIIFSRLAVPAVRTAAFDPEWRRFFLSLPSHGVSAEHHVHALGRVLELVRIGAGEPHVEVVEEDREVVFTWNDGARYLHLAIRPEGRTRWFFDDGDRYESGRCAHDEPLPPAFKTHLGAMGA